MALLELSDGLSNEACVSLGNKLVCSDAASPVAPPAVCSLICAAPDEGGGEGDGQNKVHKAGREEVKKKKGEWDESCNLLCWSIYISFQSMRVLYMLNEHSAFHLFIMEGGGEETHAWTHNSPMWTSCTRPLSQNPKLQ